VHVPGSGGAANCGGPIPADCSLNTPTGTGPCTLASAIALACHTCALCNNMNAVVRGARYTYVEFLNVDVAQVYAFDASGALVAVLSWSANQAFAGCAWSCAQAAPDFDPTEVQSLLPAYGGVGLDCSSTDAAID
jgi:hypothetical protein